MLSSVLKALLRSPLYAWRARRARKLYVLAMAEKNAGDFDGARRDLEQAIVTDPLHAEAHHWLGILDARRQAYADSIAHLEKALEADPENIEVWIDLGNVQVLHKEYVKASASYRAALDRAPDAALAHLNLGFALREIGSQEEAVAHIRRAYVLDPQIENGLRNLVNVLVETDRCEEALAIASKAVESDPDRYDAVFCEGLAHQKLHEPEKALACYSAASRLRADDAELHDNCGTALLELGRMEEAIAAYERALALRPDFALAAFHRALAHLSLGNFRAGWDGYELRQIDRDYPRHPEIAPRWDGGPLAGRTLLILREQGLGDEIMFASCLPQVLDLARHGIIECEPRLLGIFRRSFPQATVYASPQDGSLPAEVAALQIDLASPAGSLPRFIRREAGEFPHHSGYLKADTERLARWRERLAGMGPGLKVGISWTGGVRKTRRALRSLPLEQWLPILRTPGACFVSLQYTEDAGKQVAALERQYGTRIEHWTAAIDDYEETAALVGALDLVVSVCTAVIHLGGALGRPVWVMAPYSPEWRYGFSGDTMRWYPSVKIFRQPAFGEWGPVVAMVAAALGQRAGEGH